MIKYKTNTKNCLFKHIYKYKYVFDPNPATKAYQKMSLIMLWQNISCAKNNFMWQSLMITQLHAVTHSIVTLPAMWKHLFSLNPCFVQYHYNDVIMRAMASQTTWVPIVYSTVCSGADQRKHQCSASLAFACEETGDRWITLTKGPVTPKMFPFDDVIMMGIGASFSQSFTDLHTHSVCRTSLKRKCLHFDEIFITGCTESCQNDNFQCSQWWKFHQNDDIFVSVMCCVFAFMHPDEYIQSVSSTAFIVS